MSMSARIAVVMFEERAVRTALIRTGGKAPVILEAHEAAVHYTDPEHRESAVASAAAQAIGAMKGPVSAWVLCAPSGQAAVRMMRIPFKGRAKVAAVVPGELEQYLAIPIDELIVDHTVVRELEGKTDVLAVAARESMLASQSGVMREAGIQVEAITLDVAALTSLWRTRRKTVAAMEAILHVREQGAYFVIVTPKTIATFRPIALTLAQVRANPAAVVMQVRNSIRAFLASWEGEIGLERLTVTGAGLAEELGTALEEGLSMAVTIEDLMLDVKGVDKIAEAGAALGDSDGTAAGLWSDLDAAVDRYAPLVGAATGLTGKGYSFNLLRGSLRTGRSNKTLMSHLAFSGALAVAGILGYGAYCFADYRSNMRRIDLIGQEIWTIHQQCFPNSAQTERPANDLGGRYTIASLESQALAGAEGPFANIPIEWLTKPMLLDIMGDLGRLLPNDVAQVTNLKIGSGRNEQVITVEGTFSTQKLDAFNAAIGELMRDSAIFANAQSPSIQQSGTQANFSITAPY